MWEIVEERREEEVETGGVEAGVKEGIDEDYGKCDEVESSYIQE